jgi:LacI family transcriptional regulator
VGISERLAEEGLELKLFREDPETFTLRSRPRRILPELSNTGILGFILLYPFQVTSVEHLSSKFPTITALDDYERLEVDSVDVDAQRGISRLVEHLAENGHREFGFLSWRYKVATPWVEGRFGAYVESLFRLGLRFSEERLINVRRTGQVGPDEVINRAQRMIESGVTALVCAADHQAYHLIDGLKLRGIRVPKDVSVTGFDGLIPPPGMPQLATVRQPFRDIGYSTVVSLMRRVKSPAAPRRHILVGGRFIEGETVGCIA